MNDQVLNPGRLLEISGKYWMACTLHAGVKLDVFTVIGDRRLTSGEIAKKISADERATAMLLNALVAMELLQKRDDTFANTEMSAAFLSKDSSRYVGYIIMHHHHLVASWSKLDQSVRTGAPARDRISFSDEEVRESFIMGMFNMAMSLAPKIASLIDLSNRRHLLDLGGGPGTYAIHFCLANPNLTATVYDLPTTRTFAEKTIRKFKLSDRITFTPGDYVEEGIEGSYDVAWLSHILHGENPENCQQIINKTAGALNPGGLLIVHDFILNNTVDGPLFPALFSLNMLLGTDGGQAYSEEQIKKMFATAGLTDIRRISFQSPNDSGIITGTVS